MASIVRQYDTILTFFEVYECLKHHGPAICISSRGTKYTVRADNSSGRETIIGCLKTGEVRIHEDCWTEQLTCQGTRAGGVYNGKPSIYDWFDEKVRKAP